MFNKIFGGKLAQVALATVVLLGGSFSASATIIDSFNDSQAGIAIATGSGSSVLGGLSATEVLGTERELSLTVNSNTGSQLASLNVTDGLLNFNNGTGVDSTAMVTWDGIASGGLGGVDITNGGLSFAIVVNVVAADLGGMIRLDIEDTGAGSAFVTQAIGPGAGAFVLPFASFVGVDFGALDLVKLTITGPDALDVSINFIETSQVPEPSTMLLSGLALLALGGLSRLRRKA
jgi:hypothetical protein